MQSYPGGLAVSRAIGDLNARAVICKPECTRMPVPASGGRVVLASDGLWNALGDGEVATIAHEAESSRSAAHALLRAVFQRRGAHDDITLVVVDVPPPPLVQKWAAGRSDVAAGADKLAAVNGDEKVSPLGNARARKSAVPPKRASTRRRSLLSTISTARWPIQRPRILPLPSKSWPALRRV